MKRSYVPRYSSKKEYESNLSEFRVQHGLTIKELCALAGVNQNTYSDLNSGVVSPVYKTGIAKPSALKLAQALGADLFDLFPRYFCSINEHKEISKEEIINNWHVGLVANDPLDDVLLKEKQDIANEVYRKIRPIYRKVLKLRIVDELTREDIAKIIGVSIERVRQLEVKATNSFLWHSTRNNQARELRECA